MVERLFLKIDRIRRLRAATSITACVRRGPDGSFGLGLSDDNALLELHHDENKHALRLGDQIVSVSAMQYDGGTNSPDDSVPLVRERLAAVIERHFAERDELQLHILRPKRPKDPASAAAEDVFAVLELLRSDGGEMGDLVSDLWEYREAASWGAFWTVTLPAGAAVVRVGLHRSHLFSEPLIGSTEVELDAIPKDGGTATRWHALRRSGDDSTGEVHGEVLLSLRRYAAGGSVSPGVGAPRDWQEEDDELDALFAESLLVAPLHEAAPIRPIEEP